MFRSSSGIGTPPATAINRPKTALTVIRPLLLMAAALAIAFPAAALQVTPTYQVFQLKPGARTEGRMTLTNNESESVTVLPSVKEWFKLNVNEAFNVEGWLRLDEKKEFTLGPGESRVISYTIAPPKKAKGELAGAITFSTKPKANMVTLQLSVVQYAGLTGTEKMAMEIDGLGVRISSNTEVGAAVRNTGNVHIRPAGFIYIEDANGKRVANVEIPQNQPVFPGAVRMYAGTVKGFRLPEGRYTARIELSDIDRPMKFPVESKKFSVDADGKVEVRR